MVLRRIVEGYEQGVKEMDFFEMLDKEYDITRILNNPKRERECAELLFRRERAGVAFYVGYGLTSIVHPVRSVRSVFISGLLKKAYLERANIRR